MLKERREADRNVRAPNRREFLMASGRYLGLGALASLVAAQEMKRRRLEGDPNCIRIATCRECIEFQGCNKTKAQEFRIAGRMNTSPQTLS
jgi:hypothetical protein